MSNSDDTSERHLHAHQDFSIALCTLCKITTFTFPSHILCLLCRRPRPRCSLSYARLGGAIGSPSFVSHSRPGIGESLLPTTLRCPELGRGPFSIASSVGTLIFPIPILGPGVSSINSYVRVASTAMSRKCCCILRTRCQSRPSYCALQTFSQCMHKRLHDIAGRFVYRGQQYPDLTGM